MGTPARVVVLPQEQAPLRVEEITLPDPGPDQVLVKLFSSGVCHSQLHQIHQPRKTPVVLGHEATGVVLKAGERVSHVKEGETALVTWVPRNSAKAAGPPAAATLEVSGGVAQSQNVYTWADHTLADQQYVVKADPHIQKDVTCVIGCAVITGAGAVIHTAKVQPGESVAIFGVGGVGLSAVAAAKKAGAGKIIAVDLDDKKLEFAKSFGATHCINASNVDPVKAIHELTRHEGEYTFVGTPVSGVDYAFDCIGIQKTMEQILPACRRGHFGARDGGSAVLVGVPTTKLEINAMDVLLNEKKFIGSFGGSCTPEVDFPRFLKWHEQGDLDLNALVTARYTIDQINEAVNALENGEISGRAILVFDD
ncbi:MAG: zinc-binding dehydrogenase [Deltaproteobacteria bacterium]|nr:zinc-binding dehydrogenase [Deltaproteobacteria bacterium]MBW2142525.1 zinc-binding dehydrogenase [Deltaproteobacteria bacterium]MBW2324554.1 zinc-binding dehydrogenase [Deltaproteobacteria bacterium]